MIGVYKMNKIDKMYEIKKFLTTIYEQAIGERNDLTDNQYIRVFQNDKDKIYKLFTKII
jgi:hypothetical protein